MNTTDYTRGKMNIESIRIRNYKVFRDITLENIPSYFVVVGQNGSGKTTLFDLFGFLRDCLEGNVDSALQKRGGFYEVISRNADEKTILIEIKVRFNIQKKSRLVTYHLEIGHHRGSSVVVREFLKYKRGKSGYPKLFLDYRYGEGFFVGNEQDFDAKGIELQIVKQSLDSPSILAIKGLGQFDRFIAAKSFRFMLENWYISDFHINRARGEKDYEYAEHLSPSGDNLASYASRIYKERRDIFNQVLLCMQSRIPGVKNVEAKELYPGRIILRFQDGSFKDPFIDRYVSDGTIKMFAYLLLLNDPSPHPLLCIEEPENQLYPALMEELAEEFQEYSDRGGQVFVSTHSPDFLNAVPVESIYWLDKKDGYSSVYRVGENQTIHQLCKEGDKPGYLWKQGVFERFIR